MTTEVPDSDVNFRQRYESSQNSLNPPLLSIEQLHVRFSARDGDVHAVNGVSLAVSPGRVLVLLGESGSGKSVTLKSIMRLHPPARTHYQGRIQFNGHSMLDAPRQTLQQLRGESVAMIFQEPMLAFDPVFTVGQQIAETLTMHFGLGRTEARQRALELFDQVQIPSADRRLDAYPHELSGGMRQRAMIALALSCQPKLLLADEPTTALDATVQMQIIVLLRQLQKELGMAMVFVTHDVGVAAEIAHDVAVMYAGQLVEKGAATDVLSAPKHPYTRGLLASTVHGVHSGGRLETIGGSPPLLLEPLSSCGFAPRCRYADGACTTRVPDLRSIGSARCVRCVLA